LRLGTVRPPPRGAPTSDFAKLDYYDVWFPNLAPSVGLVQEARVAENAQAWLEFTRKFRREMSEPDRSRDLDVLAALSHQTNFSLGCYCEDESRLPPVGVADAARRTRRGCGLIARRYCDGVVE
jgi:uncharacterized protein YeaO (DUF488 family)